MLFETFGHVRSGLAEMMVLNIMWLVDDGFGKWYVMWLVGFEVLVLYSGCFCLLGAMAIFEHGVAGLQNWNICWQ